MASKLITLLHFQGQVSTETFTLTCCTIESSISKTKQSDSYLITLYAYLSCYLSKYNCGFQSKGKCLKKETLVEIGLK